MSMRMFGGSGLCLLASLAVSLTGCAGQTPSASDATAMRGQLVLEAAIGVASVPLEEAEVGPALNKMERDPAAPAATSSRGAAGNVGGGAGLPLPMPITPSRVNLHRLDRVAGLPVREGPLSEPLRQVAGVAVDPESGMVFACDPLRHQIRAIAPDGRSWVVAGSASSVYGFDGDRLPAMASRLNSPVGLTFDPPSGALLVADSHNHRIRYFQPGGLIYTLAGGGTDTADIVPNALQAAIGEPFGVASDAHGHTWFTERDTGNIRRITGTGKLETMARLPAGRAGAITIQTRTGLAWVTDDQAIYLVDPAKAPALQPVPVFAPRGVRISAIAHDQRDALIVSTTSETAPGTTGTRILRISLSTGGGLALGNRVEWLAGRGNTGASAAEYILPTSTVPDATQQLLAGAGFCGLAIDWTRGVDREGVSGLIYAGQSFAGAEPAAFQAEVFRLTPQPLN